MKNAIPWEGPMLEKFKEDSLLWVGPHMGAGEVKIPLKAEQGEAAVPPQPGED